MNTKIEFKEESTNIINLLSVLRMKKDEIEKNNYQILVSNKYMKDLKRRHDYHIKDDVIYFAAKHAHEDYHYLLLFQTTKIDNKLCYKLINVETNDYEYKDVFVTPNEEKEVNILYFDKQPMKLFGR